MRRSILLIFTLIGLLFWAVQIRKANAQLDVWEYVENESTENLDASDSYENTDETDFPEKIEGEDAGPLYGDPTEQNTEAEITGAQIIGTDKESEKIQNLKGKIEKKDSKKNTKRGVIFSGKKNKKAYLSRFYDFQFQGIILSGLLFTTALLFLFLHLILPLRSLSFIPKLGSFFIFLGFASALATLIYTHLQFTLPILTREKALLWFIISSTIALMFSRRSFPKSFLPCLFTTIPITGAFIWILGSQRTPTLLYSLQTSQIFSLSLLALYIALGFLSTSVAWLISSGITKLLGYNSKIYGVDSYLWPEYRSVSHKLSIFSYIFLSASLFGITIVSIFKTGSLSLLLGDSSRQLLTIPVLWLSLSAYHLSLRLPPPQPSIYEEDEPEELRVPKPRALPGMILLLSSIVGFVLFTELYRYFL